MLTRIEILRLQGEYDYHSASWHYWHGWWCWIAMSPPSKKNVGQYRSHKGGDFFDFVVMGYEDAKGEAES